MARIAQGLRSITHPDGTVILDIEHETIIALNPMGSFVWDRLRQGRRADEITRELAIETGEDTAVIDRDLCSFLDELAEKHLFEK